MIAMLMQERFQEAVAPSIEMGGRTVWGIYELPLVPLLSIQSRARTGNVRRGSD